MVDCKMESYIELSRSSGNHTMYFYRWIRLNIRIRVLADFCLPSVGLVPCITNSISIMMNHLTILPNPLNTKQKYKNANNNKDTIKQLIPFLKLCFPQELDSNKINIIYSSIRDSVMLGQITEQLYNCVSKHSLEKG